MCIRDSAEAEPLALLKQVSETPDTLADIDTGSVMRIVTRPSQPTASVTVTSYAVSYTHLRAHETVLDLVCRLLLEKKKTTKVRTTL